MHPVLSQIRDLLVSLRLTVVLLVASLILVFVATLAQTNYGIYTVQEGYFRSFIAIWHVGPLYVPLPGGYLVGGLLFINLIAAHMYRFKLTWRKAGIFLTHIGLILLLVGELLTGILQEDFSMQIIEGESRNYSESFQDNELAIIDVTDPEYEEVVAIPESLIADGESIQHQALPFRVVPRLYYPNARLQLRSNVPNPPPAPETVDVGRQVVAFEQPITYRQDERNFPTAYVELVGSQGSLGTWLVSTELQAPQYFDYAGRQWKMLMRFTRDYKPFTLTLREVRHDKYPGTEIPRNFSSLVHITTPGGGDDRDALIYMNSPLRYGGYTFYQYQMDAASDLTVLQVVRNPGWLIPYIACVLMGLGLFWQFSYHLVGFLRKQRRSAA
jgi:hypothetical protein